MTIQDTIPIPEHINGRFTGFLTVVDDSKDHIGKWSCYSIPPCKVAGHIKYYFRIKLKPKK